MTSAPVPREPADSPSVNVLRSSLALFSLYIATTVIVSLALAAASIDLHPATRFFIWLVMSAAVGYGLLRRHGRYPSPPTLGLILGLAIFWILGMSVAATLRLEETVDAQPYDLLVKLFPEELLRVFRLYPVEYHCPWNPASVERVLRSLGRSEVESILSELGEVVVKNEICNHEYRFDRDAVEAVFA